MPESRSIMLTVDGRAVEVPSGTSVAAAILRSGAAATRRSVSGEPRGPLCGMGICYECRATVDGRAQRTTCQTPCRPGMEVWTNEF